MRKALFVAAALALWAGAATASGPPPEAREYALDFPADLAPVWCGERLYLFSSDGRNQPMVPGDEAPGVSPSLIVPALQPVCGPEGALVLDRNGELWRFSQGHPAQVQGGLRDALALWPLPTGLAALFGDLLLLPGGHVSPLPFEASAGDALAGGGFWVRDGRQAARLDAAGRVLWTWTPRHGAPGPATLNEGTLYAGTTRGELVALDDRRGRVRYRYRGGGEVLSPPHTIGDRVLWASSDHFVRCLHGPSGSLIWQFRAAGRPAFGPFAVEAGVLFAEAAGTRLFVLDLRDGRKLWDWKAPRGSILKSPAVSAGRAAVLAWAEEATPVLYVVPLPPGGSGATQK
jgi:hypothetical protein